MPRKKIGVQGELFYDYMNKLDKLGGKDAMRKAVEEALEKSGKYVTPKLQKAMAKNNLPAHGKYSSGTTLESIDETYKIAIKSGYIYSMNVGFNFDISGLTSIFLMYGTPKMSPVKGLKSAIYGDKSQRDIYDIQCETLNKAIKKLMEGK